MESLCRDSLCPIELWKRTQAAIRAEAGAPDNRLHLSRWAWPAVAALAAMVLVAVGLTVYLGEGENPAFLKMDAHTVAELADTAQFSAGSIDDLNQVLRDSFDMKLAMHPLDAEGVSQVPYRHPRSVVGARHVAYQGEDAIELFFNCCTRPVKIVVMREDGPAARAVGSAVAEGQVQAVRRVGGYVAALVGGHDAPGLLDYLTDDLDMLARHV